MSEFEFHPELFHIRQQVLEKLADCGYVWLDDFGSVDLAHDLVGLEVTGIREAETGRAIEAVLRRLLPGWPHVRNYYQDHGSREVGWKVVISSRPETFGDDWQRVG